MYVDLFKKIICLVNTSQASNTFIELCNNFRGVFSFFFVIRLEYVWIFVSLIKYSYAN